MIIVDFPFMVTTLQALRVIIRSVGRKLLTKQINRNGVMEVVHFCIIWRSIAPACRTRSGSSVPISSITSHVRFTIRIAGFADKHVVSLLSQHKLTCTSQRVEPTLGE